LAKEYKNDKVYVANGETLVDALAVVPLAAASQSPVVLVNQQLEKATKDFVKLTMATDDMVAVGGEAVVPSTGMNALTSKVSYTEDNANLGSTDASKLEILSDNVQITGNNVTLKNAKAEYSIYLKGNTITLSNLTVKGTVFVDPGDNGSATLDGVSAANIVILSGAKDSIHLNNTAASVLTVDSSSSDVHIESTGVTVVGSTVVRSYAIIEAKSGSLGQVVITSSPGESPVVELRGTFNQTVVVQGQSTVRASGATVSLQVSPRSADQIVTLEGTFKTIEVNKEAQLHLGASAVITDLIANGKANIEVTQGAQVVHFDNKGNTVVCTGSGANAIPASSSTSTTGTTGSTSGGGSTTPTVPSAVTISNLQVITDPANSLGTFNNGALIDLSGLDDEVKVIGFGLTADQDCTLQFKVLSNVENISVIAGQERIVSVGDLITGGLIEGGVNLGTFRLLYKTKTLQGQILQDGTSVGKLTVNLKFKN
jgi:hypothetical protein